MWYVVAFLAGAFLMKEGSSEVQKSLTTSAILLEYLKRDKAALQQYVVQEIRRLYLSGELQRIIEGNSSNYCRPDRRVISDIERDIFVGDIKDFVK